MEKTTCATAEEFRKHRKKHTGIKDVRFVIAVGSGKGGVGKTTVSALLGMALKQAGYDVGIFDLDFYGPNVNLAFGLRDKKPVIEFGEIKPVTVLDGIRLLSLALMISEKDPIFMRGLMASKLLQELLQKVKWGPLDFLILDLPPGTGDIFLTMLDLFKPEGFILVTTSHKMALVDARRTLVILREMEVPILGVVKNMSGFFENEEAFEEFLKRERLPLLFEVPVFKSLARLESLPEAIKEEGKEDLLEELGDKVLDKVFRVH